MGKQHFLYGEIYSLTFFRDNIQLNNFFVCFSWLIFQTLRVLQLAESNKISTATAANQYLHFSLCCWSCLLLSRKLCLSGWPTSSCKNRTRCGRTGLDKSSPPSWQISGPVSEAAPSSGRRRRGPCPNIQPALELTGPVLLICFINNDD